MLDLVAMLMVGAAPAVASTHPVDVEKRLAFLVGDWTLEGASKTYREQCVWYRNRAFVVCSAEDKKSGTVAQTIYGYSRLRERFTYQHYNSNGAVVFQLGFPSGEEGIVYTDERPSSGGVARVQTTIEPDELGVPSILEYRSTNGGPWTLRLRFQFQPLPAKRRR